MRIIKVFICFIRGHVSVFKDFEDNFITFEVEGNRICGDRAKLSLRLNCCRRCGAAYWRTPSAYEIIREACLRGDTFK